MRSKVFRFFCLAAVIIAALLVTGAAAAEKTVLLTFAGDVTLGGLDKERNNADSFDGVAKQQGYDYFFANFREMFEKDDLTFVNLEQALTDKENNRSGKKQPLRGKTDFAKILSQSSIEMVSLANNHTGDYGKQGETSTQQALEDNGIRWAKYPKYEIYEKDGIRIAFFALRTIGVFNDPKDRAKLSKAISQARETDGANAVIVYWHEGTEYKTYHEAEEESRAKNLIELDGVDLVVMSHPHVAQGMSIFNNRCVFYSLGNFVFGGSRYIRSGPAPKDPYAISLYAMVVQAKLTFANDGKYLGQQLTVYPIFTSSTKPDYQLGDYFPPSDRIMFPNNYQPMRLTVKQAEAVYECIRRDSTVEIPQMTEKDGLAEIVFPYLPAFDGVMIPEDSDADGGAIGSPEAASPRVTRESKDTDTDDEGR